MRGVVSSGNDGRQCIAAQCTRARAHTATPKAIISAARGWLGTPYHDQASVKNVGCDCLGLIRGVWREVVGPEPLKVPPYSRGWGELGHRDPLIEAARNCMAPSGLVAGAVLVFRMRAGAVAKHMGILTGTGSGGAVSFILMNVWASVRWSSPPPGGGGWRQAF